MLSFSTPASAAKAATYYREEYTRGDYYTEGEEVLGQWGGRLAGELGLSGGIQREPFQAVTEGRHPCSGEVLVRGQAATGEHRAGFDGTFSAPKSLSIQALVGGDQRLVEAHQRAVEKAMAEAEAFVQARRSALGRAYTGSLLYARFTHDTSRALDPQLHTHCFVMNMTRDGERIRSVDPAELYRAQGFLTAVYRAELAREAQALGYRLEVKGDGSFELTGYRKEQLAVFSKRRAEILAAMAAQELSGAGAAQNVAHQTRDAKAKDVDRVALQEAWVAEARAQGMDPWGLQAAAETRAARGEVQAPSPAERIQAAQEAVSRGLAHLSEREAVFRGKDLEAAALRAGMGRTDLEAVRGAVGQLSGVLRLAGPGPDGRIVTEAELAREQRLVEAVRAGRGTLAGLRPGASAMDLPTWFNAGQREAVTGILGSRDQVVILEGRAGAGKSTVLGQVQKVLEGEGWTVMGLAPTRKAAEVLAKDGLRATTVADFALHPGQLFHPEAQAARRWLIQDGRAAWKELKGLGAERRGIQHQEHAQREVFAAARQALRQEAGGLGGTLEAAKAMLQAETRKLTLAEGAARSEFLARRLELAERQARVAARVTDGKAAVRGLDGTAAHLAAREQVEAQAAAQIGKLAARAEKAWAARATWARTQLPAAGGPGLDAPAPLPARLKAEGWLRAHVAALREVGQGTLAFLEKQAEGLGRLARRAEEALKARTPEAWAAFREVSGAVVGELRADLARSWEGARKALLAPAVAVAPEGPVPGPLPQPLAEAPVRPRAALVVDEAGMLSNAQLEAVQAQVQALETQGVEVRLILAGDPGQLPAVEAGKPLELLMKEGAAEVYSLREIQRQQDPELRQVAQLASEGRGGEALAVLAQRGGLVEEAEAGARHAALAQAYVEAPAGTLVLTPVNAERRALNEAIREALKASGQLSTGELFRAETLVKGAETRAQLRSAENYEVGDLVRWSRGDRELGIAPGAVGKVVVRHLEEARLTVVLEGGARLEVAPGTARGLEKVRVEAREFAVGERVVFLRNDSEQGIANHDTGTIRRLDGRSGEALVALDKGRTVAVALGRDRDLDHGYALTIHKSQGQTVERCLVSLPAGRGGVTRNLAYVAETRAVRELKVWTDDREALERAVMRGSSKSSALEAVRTGRAVESHGNAAGAAERSIHEPVQPGGRRFQGLEGEAGGPGPNLPEGGSASPSRAEVLEGGRGVELAPGGGGPGSGEAGAGRVATGGRAVAGPGPALGADARSVGADGEGDRRGERAGGPVQREPADPALRVGAAPLAEPGPPGGPGTGLGRGLEPSPGHRRDLPEGAGRADRRPSRDLQGSGGAVRPGRGGRLLEGGEGYGRRPAVGHGLDLRPAGADWGRDRMVRVGGAAVERARAGPERSAGELEQQGQRLSFELQPRPDAEAQRRGRETERESVQGGLRGQEHRASLSRREDFGLGLSPEKAQAAERSQAIHQARADLTAAKLDLLAIPSREAGNRDLASARVREAEERLYFLEHGARSDLGRVPEALVKVEARIHALHRGYQEVARVRPDLGVKSPFTAEGLRKVDPKVFEKGLGLMERVLEGLQGPVKEGRDPGREAVQLVLLAFRVAGLAVEVGRRFGVEL